MHVTPLVKEPSSRKQAKNSVPDLLPLVSRKRQLQLVRSETRVCLPRSENYRQKEDCRVLSAPPSRSCEGVEVGGRTVKCSLTIRRLYTI